MYWGIAVIVCPVRRCDPQRAEHAIGHPAPLDAEQHSDVGGAQIMRQKQIQIGTYVVEHIGIEARGGSRRRSAACGQVQRPRTPLRNQRLRRKIRVQTNASGLLADVVKWFICIIALVAAFDALGLSFGLGGRDKAAGSCVPTLSCAQVTIERVVTA